MTHDILERKFTRIGARLKLTDRINPDRGVRLDVRRDGQGEFFEILRGPSTEARVEVLDLQPADRHLLLMVREDGAKSKFLCGHDERHWFVAAIPEAASVGTVRAAKEALKPAEVQAAQARLGLPATARNRRKNAAYRRQGEWFFIPVPMFRVDERMVLHDEPITRGNGSKPHRAEFCFRRGGQTVYICRYYPSGVDEAKYRHLLVHEPESWNWGWRVMRVNPEVYVRGRIRHADHKTIKLSGWHRVVMNTENQAEAMRNVLFLD